MEQAVSQRTGQRYPEEADDLLLKIIGRNNFCTAWEDRVDIDNF